MNLDELRSVQSKERQKDSLQQLRESFYQDVAAYIQDLRAERDRRAERVDNPFSDDEVRQLSDELDTAEEVAEALYERRVGKVVKLASFAAADMSASEEGMTVEEQELFDDLVERIRQNKASVLDVLAGESGMSSPTDTAGSTPTETTESTPTETTESSPTAGEPPTIGGATTEDAHSPPTPPEAETETDDVLATAMGGAADAESSSNEHSTAETPTSGTDTDGTDAAPNGTDTTAADEDGVPTPDGGSTTHPPQSTDTQPTPNSVAGSEPTAAATESATTPNSETTTATPTATPDAEPARNPESPPQRDAESPPQTGSQAAEPVSTPEPTATGSESTHQTTSETAAPAEPGEREPTAESTAPDAATQGSTHQDAESTETGADSTPRTMVRITDDVGTIFAVDEREYTLQKGDVVTLPTTNAEVLLKQNAATALD